MRTYHNWIFLMNVNHTYVTSSQLLQLSLLNQFWIKSLPPSHRSQTFSKTPAVHRLSISFTTACNTQMKLLRKNIVFSHLDRPSVLPVHPVAKSSGVRSRFPTLHHGDGGEHQLFRRRLLRDRHHALRGDIRLWRLGEPMEALFPFTILLQSNFCLLFVSIAFLLPVCKLFNFLVCSSIFWMNLILHLQNRRLLSKHAAHHTNLCYLLRALLAPAGQLGHPVPLLLHPPQVLV